MGNTEAIYLARGAQVMFSYFFLWKHTKRKKKTNLLKNPRSEEKNMQNVNDVQERNDVTYSFKIIFS